MKAISYRNGDQIEYTGKTMKIHGGLFYEFTYLDGLKKGENGVTQNVPEEKHLTPSEQFRSQYGIYQTKGAIIYLLDAGKITLDDLKEYYERDED